MSKEISLPANYKELSWSERKRVREMYVKIQKGKCSHCGAELNGPASDKIIKTFIRKSLFPKNFFKYPVHLHHNHDTNMTIGAVHAECNAVLWQYYGK